VRKRGCVGVPGTTPADYRHGFSDGGHTYPQEVRIVNILGRRGRDRMQATQQKRGEKGSNRNRTGNLG